MASGNRRWGFNGYNGYNVYGAGQATSTCSSDDFESRFRFNSSSRFPTPPPMKKLQKTYPSKQPNRQNSAVYFTSEQANAHSNGTKRGQPPAPPRQ